MGNYPIDQVVRKERFLRQHPEVAYTYDQWNKVHRATVDAGGATYEVVKRELRPLLDRLEEIVK